MHHIEEILHEIGFIEDIETATTVLEVIQKCPKPCSTISRTCKIDLIRLTSYHRQPCVSKFCDIRKNDLAKFHMELATRCSIIEDICITLEQCCFNIFRYCISFSSFQKLLYTHK